MVMMARPQRQDTMRSPGKIAHTAETVKGRVTRIFGRLAGSRRLRAEGQAGAKITDVSGR
jgi:uncharacterized protein YjbJ (UPF0337 family)